PAADPGGPLDPRPRARPRRPRRRSGGRLRRRRGLRGPAHRSRLRRPPRRTAAGNAARGRSARRQDPRGLPALALPDLPGLVGGRLPLLDRAEHAQGGGGSPRPRLHGGPGPRLLRGGLRAVRPAPAQGGGPQPPGVDRPGHPALARRRHPRRLPPSWGGGAGSGGGRGAADDSTGGRRRSRTLGAARARARLRLARRRAPRRGTIVTDWTLVAAVLGAGLLLGGLLLLLLGRRSAPATEAAPPTSLGDLYAERDLLLERLRALEFDEGDP